MGKIKQIWNSLFSEKVDKPKEICYNNSMDTKYRIVKKTYADGRTVFIIESDNHHDYDGTYWAKELFSPIFYELEHAQKYLDSKRAWRESMKLITEEVIEERTI